MAVIDLLTCVPEEVAQTASLEDVLDTVRSIEVWQERQAAVLDYVYSQRLVRLLAARAPVEELTELSEHLNRVAHPRRAASLNALEKPYAARWLAYRDTLEARIHGLRSDTPQRLLERAHVKEIVELVGSGRAQCQQDVETALGLRKANVTRILNLMEASELIVRRKVGRENGLALGPAAVRLHEERHEAPLVRRGLDFLSAA